MHGPEGCIEILVLEPGQRIEIRGKEHQEEAREDECDACNNSTYSASRQASEEHAKLGRLGTRKDLIDREDALEPRESYPFVFDDQLVFDECDLCHGASPCKQTEVIEEEPEELEEGKLGNIGIIFQARIFIFMHKCRAGAHLLGSGAFLGFEVSVRGLHTANDPFVFPRQS